MARLQLLLIVTSVLGVFSLCAGKCVPLVSGRQFNVTFDEGGPATLPCCYPSSRPSDISTSVSVRWEKNGKVVLEQKSCTDDSNEIPDGRLSVSPDRCSSGSFSLNLQQAKIEDQGFYFCYINGKDCHEAVVNLTVRPPPLSVCITTFCKRKGEHHTFHFVQ